MNMETLETLYAAKIKEHDEACLAANPYGCNQYGEGWAGEHDGKRSEPGKPVKKNDKTEQTEKEDEADNSWTDERRTEYKDLRHDIKEVAYKAFSKLARNGYVGGIYFDGDDFYTDSQDGRATLLYTADDIDDFLEENDMQEATVDDQTERFMQNRGWDVFEAIDWDEVEENKKANS